jgi:hypothetical protein
MIRLIVAIVVGIPVAAGWGLRNPEPAKLGARRQCHGLSI